MDHFLELMTGGSEERKRRGWSCGVLKRRCRNPACPFGWAPGCLHVNLQEMDSLNTLPAPVSSLLLHWLEQRLVPLTLGGWSSESRAHQHSDPRGPSRTSARPSGALPGSLAARAPAIALCPRAAPRPPRAGAPRGGTSDPHFAALSASPRSGAQGGWRHL